MILVQNPPTIPTLALGWLAARAHGFPAATPELDRLREGACASRRPTWREAWMAEAWPVLAG